MRSPDLERKNGFYWVKYTIEWEVAQWYGYKPDNPDSTGYWLRTAYENAYVDNEFEEIDERRIVEPDQSEEE